MELPELELGTRAEARELLVRMRCIAEAMDDFGAPSGFELGTAWARHLDEAVL